LPAPSAVPPLPPAPCAFPLLSAIDAFLVPSAIFTPIETLSPDEKREFEADEFLDLMKIPIRTPAREYC